MAAKALDADGLKRYTRGSRIITDDNQLLAYNWSYQPWFARFQELAAANHERVRRAAKGP